MLDTDEEESDDGRKPGLGVANVVTKSVLNAEFRADCKGKFDHE